MKSDLAWLDQNASKDPAFGNVVWDLAYRPDGSEIVAAVGNRVLIYEATRGELLQSLRHHRDNVYAVSYARDGKRFASGGGDKTVIIWSPKGEGILKYMHADGIQCLAFNPITQQLASGTEAELGLWSPEQSSVNKFKVGSRILCLSWTSDGQTLALGHFNGTVSIRDNRGAEKCRFERPAPIWTLEFNPAPVLGADLDVLAVGCWDQTLSFYSSQGQQIGKDRVLGYDPCSISFHRMSGEYHRVGVGVGGGVALRVTVPRAAALCCAVLYCGVRALSLSHLLTPPPALRRRRRVPAVRWL